MPTLTLNAKGRLVDEKGNVVSIDGSEVTVENAVTKETMETTIEDRVKRLRAEKGKSDETIKTLKSQKDRTKEMDGLLSDAEKERKGLVDELEVARREQATAQKTAEKDVQKQMQTYKETAEKSVVALAESEKARESERLTNMLLKNAVRFLRMRPVM